MSATTPDPATTSANAQPNQSATPEPTRTPERGPRAGTVIWGLIVAGIGALLVASAVGLTVDLELAVIVGLAVAGVLLLIGTLVGVGKRR